MSDDLKPCPFCGSDATLRNVEMVGCAYASCTNCGAMGEDASIDRAISKWNTRADTDALTAAHEESERLRDALDNLTIAIGMGWDLDGVLEAARATLDGLPR